MPRPKNGYHLKDGTQVPGVTTIIQRFKASEGLMYWAWEMGKAGKDYRGERDAAANAGTLAHALVEAYLKGENAEALLVKAEPQIIEGAKRGFENWLKWKEQTKLIVVPWETPIVCEMFKFGGTPDALLKHEGDTVIELADWKAAGAIYPEVLMQLAAYAHLLAEDYVPELKSQGFHVCRFSRDNGDFSHHYFDELDEAWEIFLHLRKAYELDKRLRKRVR